MTWLRGNDQDREAEAPETVLPEVSVEADILSLRRHGNVITAVGMALLDMAGVH